MFGVASIFRYLVRADDFECSLFIIKWIQNLVESRISLFFVKEVYELLDVDFISFSLCSVKEIFTLINLKITCRVKVNSHGTEKLFDVIPGTDFMIQFIKLIECEISFGN